MIGSTAPFIVIDTVISSSGMPSKSVRMSRMESMATPAMPTSPRIRADGRCHSRDAWRDRRRPTGPFDRRQGCAAVKGVGIFGGRESRHIAGSSRAAGHTWSGRGRARRGQAGIVSVARLAAAEGGGQAQGVGEGAQHNRVGPADRAGEARPRSGAAGWSRRRPGSACGCEDRASITAGTETPQASVSRAHSARAARTLATPVKYSPSRLTPRVMRPKASSIDRPARTRALA
jgi:hypothetical protein